MNPQMIHQLANQRISEVRREAANCQLAAKCREPRESVRERAGRVLINVGLKLTGPPSPRQHARPQSAGL